MSSPRLGFALGVALFVFGWGLTSYAEEQQQALPSQGLVRAVGWSGRFGDRYEMIRAIPSHRVYFWGVLGMGLGAGLAAYTFKPSFMAKG